MVTADPRWSARGGDLAARLAARLGVRVEHIGSTSVPGLAAKDILDLQASVAELTDADADAFVAPLVDLGFTLRPFRQDHVPAGSDDPPELWAKRMYARRDHPDGDVNLHVRRTGSPNERLALLFRDWFRAHPAAVPAYARFKRALAEVCPDIEVYADVKDPVVDLVVTVAEEWAAATGWKP